jgi:hypothetical protein
MNGVRGDELSKQLLEFQSLFVRQAYRWKMTQVSLHIPSHKANVGRTMFYLKKVVMDLLPKHQSGKFNGSDI